MGMAELELAPTLAGMAAFERERVRYHASPPEGQAAFVVVTGRRPVVVSAPHGASHSRRNHRKQHEEDTPAMAHWLAARTGAHAIYTTHAIQPDPHADQDAGAYKAALAALLETHPVKLVLDLHGARGSRDFAVALGTINGVSCPTYENLILDALRAHGFQLAETAPSLDRVALNHPRYTGGVHRQTVTRFVWEVCGVEAAQLEINAWLRVVQRLEGATDYREAPRFRGDPARILRLLDALASLVTALA